MSHTQTTRPQSATEILRTASETLGERGKQYDPNGKQERSMTAIVAAFNAIYPTVPLTVHMGWQFMSLVKMVRGATKPHADSALDQVAYAALAAECVAEQLHQPAPTDAQAMAEALSKHKEPRLTPYAGKAAEERKQEAEVDALMKQIRAGYKGCPQCGADVDKEAGSCQCGWEFEEQEEVQPTVAKQVEQLLAHNRNLEVQLDTLRASFEVEKLRERELLDIETINDLRAELASCKAMTAKFQAERKANVAMHEEVTRLRGKVQELADLAEYRDKRNSELCAELETQRGKCIAQSSRISELQTLVDNLRSSLAQATKEAPCAHNTDEPKAPRPAYVDPFDQYGDTQPLASKPRIVGGLDPARGGLAYPNGKPL